MACAKDLRQEFIHRASEDQQEAQVLAADEGGNEWWETRTGR